MTQWTWSLVGLLLMGCAQARDEGGASTNQSTALPSDTVASAHIQRQGTGMQPSQDLTPVAQLQLYVDGYHNYKSQAALPGDQQHQMRVAHYCQQVNADVIQCAVYDGNGKGAHLIGIEYIVSDPVYRKLPATEKDSWHPHDGEVDTAMLIAPGIPDPAHKALMAKIRSTHGKTWHVWDTHKDALPVGSPSLMWAITPEQMNAETKRSMAARQKNVQF
ncbi:MAG: DUF1264 domain-containing protein [Candidatus Sericytochromatia bacterium]|nr:DUF1264 domain-containing protein [Candidatus Sericytochromatia bacterium]